jgi:hypothetical protein
LAGIEPPVKVTVEPPAVAVPPQVVLALPDVTNPLGNVSTRGPVRVETTALVLIRVILIVETTPVSTLAGLKDFVSEGETIKVTDNVALAVVVLLPLLVCRALTGSKFT